MHLDRLISYKGQSGPVVLVVADGVGCAEPGPANAVSLAKTPNMDRLLNSRFSTTLHAHGTHVGLPTDSDMGNSEVGHNTLGGGRVFDQGAKLVNNAFADESIFEGGNWQEVEARGKNGNTVHFLGLLSDGNVHSHIDHLLYFLNRCKEANIGSVAVHILLDGRDVGPRSAPQYIKQLQSKLDEINSSGEFRYRIASGGGRMVITMDRYEADWAMVERGYRIHVLGDASEIGREVQDAGAEVERQYAEDGNLSDQYLSPFVVTDANGAVGKMRDGDAVVLFNFRGDRAIEISQAMENDDFNQFDRPSRPDLFFCGMLEYDGDLKVPNNYLVNPPVIERTMGEYLCGEKLKTFAISETQKFGHVTYFWNGNRSGYVDESLETYIEIPSDNLPFDQAPDMKAREITQSTIELLQSGEYKFGRINFANGDMVGHTGNVEATVQSLECVDHCLGELVDVVTDLDGVLIFTADHGNADEMFVEKAGVRIERTSHTLNPVPFVIYDGQDDTNYEFNTDVDGGLANVAATVFNLLGFRAPEDYMPSLIRFPSEPNRKSIYKGRVVDLGIETTVLPNDEMMAIEIIRHPGGAVIVAMNDNQQVCLIRQFRHAAGGWIWELPAGILDGNEDPELAARRELKEETGCNAENWQSLGHLLSTPGFCDERLYIYFASGISEGETAQEAHEFIEIHWKSVEEINDMIRDGELVDAKSIVGIHKAIVASLLN